MNTFPKQSPPTLVPDQIHSHCWSPRVPKGVELCPAVPRNRGLGETHQEGCPAMPGWPYLWRWLRPLPAACIHGWGNLVDVKPHPSRRWHLINVLGGVARPWRHLVKVWGWAGECVMGHLLRECGCLLGRGRLELWTGPRGLVEPLLGLAGGGHQVDTVRLRWVSNRQHRRVLGSWVVEARLGRGQGGRWARSGPCRLLVVHAHENLEAVPGHDALAPVQRAEPPAVQALCVPLQHRHDIPLAEGELIWGLGHVVIEGFGQHVLGREDKGGHEDVHRGLGGLPSTHTSAGHGKCLVLALGKELSKVWHNPRASDPMNPSRKAPLILAFFSKWAWIAPQNPLNRSQHLHPRDGTQDTIKNHSQSHTATWTNTGRAAIMTIMATTFWEENRMYTLPAPTQ